MLAESGIWVILIFASLIMLSLFILFSKVKSRKLIFSPRKKSDFPYVKRKSLFTAAEKSFLQILDLAVGEQYRVFGQVRLIDVIQLHQDLSWGSEATIARNKIMSKQLDFVICRRADLSLVCAIELDDGTHRLEARQQRDEFLEQALAAAHLPLVRFAVQSSYNVHVVKKKLANLL